jgi:hypothetical protein
MLADGRGGQGGPMAVSCSYTPDESNCLRKDTKQLTYFIISPHVLKVGYGTSSVIAVVTAVR